MHVRLYSSQNVSKMETRKKIRLDLFKSSIHDMFGDCELLLHAGLKWWLANKYHPWAWS